MHTILIIEDHPMMVDSIKASVQGLPFKTQVLKAHTLGELTSSKRLEELKSPSLIVADLNLPDSKGLSTLVSLRGKYLDSPILVFSQIDDPTIESRALGLGASGFISKSHPPKMFIARMHAMMSRLEPQKPTMGEPEDVLVNNAIKSLTTQQLKVLKLLAVGKSSHEIAAQLEVAEPTVRTHLTEIYHRLNVKNRTQAMVLYLNWIAEHDD
jgi:DNA-binding NarL/FixJ family response regulator